MKSRIVVVCLCSYVLATQTGLCNENNTVTPIEVIEVIASDNTTITTFNAVRSVESITLDKIDASNRLEDIAQYTAGISASTVNGGMNTSIVIRGFSTGPNNIFVNGHLDNQRMYTRDLGTVEAVSFEKGHASIAYGAASPGGAIQYVTKQPQAQSQHQIALTLGSHNKKRLMFDSTGTIGNSDSTYRTVFIKQNADSFMNNVGNDYAGFLGALETSYLQSGKARVEIQYDELENPYSFGTVRANGVIQYNKSYVDPRTYSSRKNLRTSLYLTDTITPNLFYKASLNYVDVKRDDKWMGFFFKNDETSLVNYWATFDNNAYQFNGRFALGGNGELLNVTHAFEVGVDKNNYTNKQVRYRSFRDFNLNILNPVFIQPEPADVALRRDIGSATSDLGFYALDSIALTNKAKLNIGVRHSKYKLEDVVSEEVQVDQSQNSYFVGGQYQVSSHISLRSSYAESFEPNGGQAKSGRYFDAKEASQKEVAIDYSYGTNNQITTVFYDIEQKNNLSRDPTDRDYLIESGEHYSKGIEVVLINEISEQLTSNVQYSYLKNKIVDPFSSVDGNTASNLAKHTLSGRLSWQNTSHFSAYVGFIATGKRYGDLANSFELPGYVKFDLGGTYTVNNWQFRADFINLLNKEYIAASYYEDDMYQGKPREFTITAHYTW